MKRYILFFQLFILLSFSNTLMAQKKNINYYKLPVLGKYFVAESEYHRVDTVKYNNMPSAVKNLYTNSAGMFVTFSTNAKEVYAKWCVTDKKMNLNLTAIANKGLDVYIKNKQGKWQYAGSKGTEKVCDQGKIVEDLDNTEKEYLVYLPLYDETKSLEIGIPDGASFKTLNNPFSKNIIIYGSSIVHGASASRPGLAYPAQLSRRTGYNFINFGVSGSAKMEKEVADMLADANPDLFILDCVPNSSPEQVTERTAYLVETIRAKHPNTPIIMIPSIVRELSYFRVGWNKRNADQNKNWKVEYEKLKAKGVKNLYYLDANNLLGDDHEATTDGVHPNDLGFARMIEQIEPFVLSVMQKHNIK